MQEDDWDESANDPKVALQVITNQIATLKVEDENAAFYEPPAFKSQNDELNYPSDENADINSGRTTFRGSSRFRSDTRERSFRYESRGGYRGGFRGDIVREDNQGSFRRGSGHRGGFQQNNYQENERNSFQRGDDNRGGFQTQSYRGNNRNSYERGGDDRGGFQSQNYPGGDDRGAFQGQSYRGNYQESYQRGGNDLGGFQGQSYRGNDKESYQQGGVNRGGFQPQNSRENFQDSYQRGGEDRGAFQNQSNRGNYQNSYQRENDDRGGYQNQGFRGNFQDSNQRGGHDRGGFQSQNDRENFQDSYQRGGDDRGGFQGQSNRGNYQDSFQRGDDDRGGFQTQSNRGNYQDSYHRGGNDDRGEFQKQSYRGNYQDSYQREGKDRGGFHSQSFRGNNQDPFQNKNDYRESSNSYKRTSNLNAPHDNQLEEGEVISSSGSQHRDNRRGEDGAFDLPELIQQPDRPQIYYPQMPSNDPTDIFSVAISEGIEFEKYDNIKVKVSGGDEKSDLINSFDQDFLISPEILSNIQKSNYRIPTPIQKFTIPIIVKEKYDIMGCAQTGSGKTAAYLIPTFSNILKNRLPLDERSIAAPLLLVIAPTRELVNQIWQEMRRFAYGTNIRTGMAYGGISRKYIYEFIKNGCDAIAATPGRLLDLVKRNEVSLKTVRYLVLDEADRMLDMGFIDPIRTIVFKLGMPSSSQRRCYMFSATFPMEIRELAREILAPDYYFITVGVVGGAADSINQEIYKVSPQDKREELIKILEKYKNSKVLVFVETKRGADFLTTYLCQCSVRSTSIHGDRFQEQREEALNMFKKGSALVLVATSVAARGLDIPKVDLVINFDLPSQIDEYVHRIGRTGRLGNKGVAISFFTPGKDEALSAPLVEILKNAGQETPSFLSQYDFQSTNMVRGSFMDGDDRSLATSTHKVHSSLGLSQPKRAEENISPVIDAVDEQWE